MAINFTDRQKEVLDARNHNILVSAAAGSGKTAVLVERIVRMISEGDHPLDIDRLLVVTFTRAAAAQMRERIGKAISDRLKEDPENGHLQKQEMLLHNAQITTIDSFCTFLLRNNFSEIDLDPGFRQMDETERALLEGEVMQEKQVSGRNLSKAAQQYIDAAYDEVEILQELANHNFDPSWVKSLKDYYKDDPEKLKDIETVENTKIVQLLNSFIYHGQNGRHFCMVFEIVGVTLLELIIKVFLCLI